MQEEKDYEGLYMVSAKDIMKATVYESGCLSYTPRGGIAYFVQRQAHENIGKLDFVIVKDYGEFYQEYVTSLPIAKGKKSNVPLYIDEDAVLAPVTEEKADKFASKSKNYVTNFYKLYASGANAIFEHSSLEKAKKLEKKRREQRRKGH